MADDALDTSLTDLQAKYVEKGGEFTAESFEQFIGNILKMNAFLNTDEWNVETTTHMHKINLRGKMNAKCGALECKNFVPTGAHTTPAEYWAGPGMELAMQIGPLMTGKAATAIDEALSTEQFEGKQLTVEECEKVRTLGGGAKFSKLKQHVDKKESVELLKLMDKETEWGKLAWRGVFFVHTVSGAKIKDVQCRETYAELIKARQLIGTFINNDISTNLFGEQEHRPLIADAFITELMKFADTEPPPFVQTMHKLVGLCVQKTGKELRELPAVLVTRGIKAVVTVMNHIFGALVGDAAANRAAVALDEWLDTTRASKSTARGRASGRFRADGGKIPARIPPSKAFCMFHISLAPLF